MFCHKFTGKHLWRSRIIEKLLDFTTIELCHRCFPVKQQFYRTPLDGTKCSEQIFWKIAVLKIVSIYCIIQFHRQLRITNSDFGLIILLLQKFDTSSKKEMKMIKTQHFWLKTTTKMSKVVYVNRELHCLLCTATTDLWCNMLQTLARDKEKM